MGQVYDLVVKGGEIVNHAGRFRADIGINGGRIAEIGNIEAEAADQLLDATGLTVLPGVIDTQVHFREPGNEHKEDLRTGSAAAALGGVTAVFEMPNTKPSTTTAEAIQDKLNRARGRMYVDHAFYVGASADNASQLGELERIPGCSGVKIFMGASTGDLLVSDDDALEEVLRHGYRRVAIHAEDEERMQARKEYIVKGDPSTHEDWRDSVSALRATERIVNLAKKTKRRIHVLHVTTADEMAFLAGVKDIASVEVTPQHLTLCAPDCYKQLGTRAQMNPPIRNRYHRDGLWWGLKAGVADVIGSDHAPHLLEEKARLYPESPSGMPGVQTLLTIMLDHVHHGRLSLERLVDMTSAGPQRLFGLVDKGRLAVGYHGDLSIVDLKHTWTIDDSWSASRCGWTPFAGRTVTGRPLATIVRGRVVMQEGVLTDEAIGQPVRFQDSKMESA